MPRSEFEAMNINDYREVVEAVGEKMKREMRRELL